LFDAEQYLPERSTMPRAVCVCAKHGRIPHAHARDFAIALKPGDWIVSWPGDCSVYSASHFHEEFAALSEEAGS
jgi:hypothetical protein